MSYSPLGRKGSDTTEHTFPQLGPVMFSASLGLKSSHFLHCFSFSFAVISACHWLPKAVVARALSDQRGPRME